MRMRLAGRDQEFFWRFGQQIAVMSWCSQGGCRCGRLESQKLRTNFERQSLRLWGWVSRSHPVEWVPTGDNVKETSWECYVPANWSYGNRKTGIRVVDVPSWQTWLFSRRLREHQWTGEMNEEPGRTEATREGWSEDNRLTLESPASNNWGFHQSQTAGEIECTAQHKCSLAKRWSVRKVDIPDNLASHN